MRPSATLDLGTERPTSPDSTHGAVVEIGTESEEKWSAVSISSDHDAEKENVPPGRLATAKMGSIEKRQKARKGDGVGKTRQFFRAVQNAFQKTSNRDWKMRKEIASSSNSLDQSVVSTRTEKDISEHNSITSDPKERMQNMKTFDNVN